MPSQSGEPDRQPHEAADDVPPAPATWVPPESPEAGARPAWLPPGAPPQPYGPQPYGQGYGPPPYGTPPPGWQQPPPYGPPARKPGMPRWAKIVIVIGVITYVLGFIGQMINILVLSR